MKTRTKNNQTILNYGHILSGIRHLSFDKQRTIRTIATLYLQLNNENQKAVDQIIKYIIDSEERISNQIIKKLFLRKELKQSEIETLKEKLKLTKKDIQKYFNNCER